MTFGKDDVVAQPPPTTNRIFITVPEGQFIAMQRRVYELERTLFEMKKLILMNHDLWVANGRPEGSHPGPIIALLLQTIQVVLK